MSKIFEGTSMKITKNHIPHISSRIAIQLNKSDFITMTHGLDPVIAESEKVLAEEIHKEHVLEEKVKSIVADNENAIEDYLADERQLFFMIKKKLAPEYDVILNYDERFSNISHKILDELYEEDLIHFDVSENRVKNVIFDAITSFIADNGEIEAAVADKIGSYKRQIIPGTEDYEILFEKLYKEELVKRGLA